MIARFTTDLAAYQDRSYSDRCADLIRQVEIAARPHGPRGQALVRTVAANAYRLMAYKEEYEVAWLYAEPDFRRPSILVPGALRSGGSDRGS